jgi:hypothetical protein
LLTPNAYSAGPVCDSMDLRFTIFQMLRCLIESSGSVRKLYRSSGQSEPREESSNLYAPVPLDEVVWVPEQHLDDGSVRVRQVGARRLDLREDVLRHLDFGILFGVRP